jgi:hypothetical protein
MSTSTKEAFVDTAVLPGASAFQGKQLLARVSCELMKNHLPASPIDPTANILVVQDQAGSPMIFTIGTDQRFHLLRFDPGSATGWSVADLTASFTGYAVATTFDVVQDHAGRITVAVALQKAGATATDLFVASMLSNGADTAWASLGTLARKIDGVDASFAATQLQVGSTDDGQPSFVIAAGPLGGQQIYYQLAAGAGAGAATRLEFPENLGSDPASLQDLAIGYAFGQRGVFFLYKTGDGQTLECTTLATPDEGALHYDYSAGNAKLPPALANLRYTCIATATGSKTDPFSICSDIYVGTSGGVYVFPNANVGGLQKVTDGIGDVHELVVTQDAHGISVWAMCSPNRVYYVSGKKGPTYTWSQPILFSSTAIHIAPIRSRVRNTNELFLVNQEDTVTHYWQDPDATTWQQRLIKVKGGSFLHDVDTFTTQLHLADDLGRPLGGQIVKVTSSEWTYVTANGLVYSLDLHNPAEIPLDFNGDLTIIASTRDIAAPILHVEADCFDKTLNVYPNGKVLQGLQAIKSGDDLKQAVTADGKPVVDPATDPGVLSGVADNLGQLTAAGASYQAGTRSPDATFLTVSDKGQKHDGLLKVSHAPGGFAVGMTLANGTWRAHPQPEALAASLGGTLEDAAGDVLHFLDEVFSDPLKGFSDGVIYLKDGASFVLQKLEDGLQLVLKLADKVFRIALKSLVTIFKALNWVLKLVGIDLRKILAWLGHLLGWDAIWNAHKLIAAVMRNGLDYMVDRARTELEGLRASVDAVMDGIDQRVRDLVLPAAIASRSPRGEANASSAAAPAVTSNRPPANMALYQMHHGGMLAGTTPLRVVAKTVQDFVDDVLVPTMKALGQEVFKDIQDLARLVSDPANSFDTLRQLVVDLFETILIPIKKLVGGLLEFAADLLGDVRDALAATMDIPFLSSFYEFITDLLGDEEDFSFVNGIALLLAIPIVEIGRIATGHAPLQDTDGLDDPRLLHNLAGASPASPAPQPLRAMALMAAAPVAADPPPSSSPTAAQRYKLAGDIVGPFAKLIADYLAMVAMGGDADGTSMWEKANAAAATVGSAFTFPVEVSGEEERVRIAAWVFDLLNSAIWWKLPGKQLKGGVMTCDNGLNLLLTVIADTLGGAPQHAWAQNFLTNLGGMAIGIGGTDDDPVAKALEVVGAFLVTAGDTTAFAYGIKQAAAVH